MMRHIGPIDQTLHAVLQRTPLLQCPSPHVSQLPPRILDLVVTVTTVEVGPLEPHQRPEPDIGHLFRVSGRSG